MTRRSSSFLLIAGVLVAMGGLWTLDLAAQSDANAVVSPAAYQDLKWRSVGPHRGGRVTAISGVRGQPCTFYQGATGGGVWKTEDCGILWTPVSDGQIATGSIGSIAVSESNPNVVYVGTGSAAIRSNVIIGRGMYRSTDAGKTWQFVGLKNSGQIGQIALHPTNSDIAWIAALGSPFGPNDERGIFKTVDGGRTWKKVLFVNSETGGRSIVVNMSNPSELYAGMYRGFRKGWDIISGGPATEGGIYKSIDGGETWKKVTSGLPQKLIGKIDLEIARSNPQVVYGMVEAPGAEGGLYRSDDAGATWKNVNNAQRLRARPFYFHYVDVNPKNENEVWVNELGMHKSTDGGKTFTPVAVPHGDNHGLWFNPDSPSIMIQCNDGGANVTIDGGKSWSSILNQATAELYMVAVDEQFPYRLYAPQQDNSTIVVPSVPPASWGYDHQAQSWVQSSGCETGGIWPRPDGSVIWGACKGEVGRYDVLTGQERMYWVYPQNRYGHDPDEIKYRYPRQTVTYLSPHNPKVIYQASHVLHRSIDEGVTWQTISSDLTAHEPDKQIVPGNPITRDVTGEEVYSSIYSMVEARLEPGVIWVGANDGPVNVTRDNGKTWKNVTPKDLAPGGRVQNIEDSPHRKGSAYAAIYRFMREHDLKPYIYKTNDYGATWTLLTDGKNGIPDDFPTRIVREDPEVEGLLYAGTEFGAFVSFDDGKHWQTLQLNLPATPVTDIRVHRGDLAISTMGRSFWIMDNITPLRQIATGMRASGGLKTNWVFTPRDAYRMRYSPTSGSPDEPTYPPAGAHVDYYFPGGPGEEVKLEIADATGKAVRSFTSEGRGAATPQGFGRFGGGGMTQVPKKAGTNRFLWDLRHAGPEGGGAGPLVVPGKYSVKMTAGAWTQTVPLTVKIDPRVAQSGVTQADLQEQLDLGLKIRDALTDARRLQQRLTQAMEKAGVKPAPAPGPGQSPSSVKYEHPLQGLWARLVAAGGVYPEPMLIDQFSNIQRMIGGADQKIGKDAWDRYNDCMKELNGIRTEADKIAK